MLCWHLICIGIAFAEASRRAGSGASAFVLPSVRCQHRKTASGASTMYHHVFKLRGRLLLSLSSRAALAASAGSYALPSHPDREPGQERWGSSSVSSVRPTLGSGWLHSSQPALAMAASGSSGARSFSTVPLRFRGGATAPDGQYRYTELQHSSTAAVPCIIPVSRNTDGSPAALRGWVRPSRLDAAAGCI